MFEIIVTSAALNDIFLFYYYVRKLGLSLLGRDTCNLLYCNTCYLLSFFLFATKIVLFIWFFYFFIEKDMYFIQIESID